MNDPTGTVHVVLPNDVDDPLRPSGGNAYDRRLCNGLAGAGWSVREHAVHGAWPQPAPTERDELARVLATLPDAALVIIDGLVASADAEVLRAQAGRLRLVVLMHMPLGEESIESRPAERQALSAAAAVITTSHWCRARLLELYGLAPDRVHAAPPGVDAAAVAPGSAGGSGLLCVAAVSPHKGHDLLLAALASIADLPWTCACVGALDRDPGFVEQLGKQAEADGIAGRVEFAGPLTGADLAARYASADLLVLASRGETYGMVVTEALARGVPVLATAVGGLPEALGLAPDGSRPGILVPPHDAVALAAGLARWLDDPALRAEVRGSAAIRRTTLTDWSVTANQVSTVLYGIATKVSIGR